MIAIVAAAPGPLIDALVDSYRSRGPVEVWAPWATPTWLAAAPGSIGRFARRRTLAGAHGSLAMIAADGALRAWARDRTDRRYLGEFVRRVAIDAWAAALVKRRRPTEIIAPTIGARLTLAAARTVGARAVLALDLPLLRTLHRDLDRAAAAWPERRFLRRFRAPSWAIARQDAERALCDVILIRGPYARDQCLVDGVGPNRIEPWPTMSPTVDGPTIADRGTRAPTKRIRLAGLAAARHGVDTALAATRALGLTLVVRTGEGTEPADVARHAGVTRDDGAVDAVVCPAVCEAYPDELVRARRGGIAIVTSPQARLDELHATADPFDVAAWISALTGGRRPTHEL